MKNFIIKLINLSVGVKSIIIACVLLAVVVPTVIIINQNTSELPIVVTTTKKEEQKTTIKEEQTTIETESNTLKAKSAYEFLGVTYKEIVDCFGNGYTWREGFGVPNMWYPDNILTYGLCFGTVPDMVVESSPVTSVLVSAQGKELYKGVCIGDDISDLERVTG